MKKQVSSIIVLTAVVMLSLFLPQVTFAQQKQRIAVYVTGDDPVNEIVANRLMSDLANSERYKPIERPADFLAALQQGHSKERGGDVNEDLIAALGKQYGLQYVCVVSVFDVWQKEKYITAHIVDVNSAIVVGTCCSHGPMTTNYELMTALDKLSKDLKGIMDESESIDSETQKKMPKVAVYVIKTGNRDIDIILGDQLVAGFIKNYPLVAVERSNTFRKQLKNGSEYRYSGNVDDIDKIAELGKRIGAQYVCVSKANSYGGAYFINTRLVDVEKGEITAVYNVENKRIDNTTDAVNIALETAEELSSAVLGLYDDLGIHVEIFKVVEKEPEFPGGLDSLYRFIAKNIRYPQEAKENNIEGKVYVNFIVEKDGSVSNPKVIRDIGGGCGEEALRVVQMMPKWKPGRQRGQRVRVSFNLPIKFYLCGGTKNNTASKTLTR